MTYGCSEFHAAGSKLRIKYSYPNFLLHFMIVHRETVTPRDSSFALTFADDIPDLYNLTACITSSFLNLIFGHSAVNFLLQFVQR